MKTAEKTLRYTIYSALEELPESLQKLLRHARNETKKAYAPYSNFKVGASVLMNNKKMIGGNNQENAAFPSGLCAERTAIFYAHSQYPDEGIEAIAITALYKGEITHETIKPCGACCQVLSETERRSGKAITIILDGQDQIEVLSGVSQLLPFRFSGEELKR